MSDKKNQSDLRLVLREYIESLFIAILLAVVIRTFVVSAYKIPSESMLPTLYVGDFLFAYKLPYGVELPFTTKKWWTGHQPERGDVVIFQHPKDKTVSFVKRVVGLPGDRIEMKAGQFFLNGEKVDSQPMPDSAQPPDGASLNSKLYAEKIGGKVFAVLSGSDNSDNYGPVLVPPNEVFLMGDNRVTSDDSRHWGTIPIENIEGKAFIIWMSLDWAHKSEGFPKPRFSRLFKTL